MTVAGPAAGASRRQAAVSFVLVTVLLDVMGIGLMIPVLPALVGEFTVSRDLQAYWYGVLGAAYGVMNFFATPILGALSDRFGRRRVLLVSIFGLGLDFLLLAVAPSLWVVLLARVVGGITGAGFTVASAYIADVTTPDERGKGFGQLGAMFGIGFIVGPMLGGLLGGQDPRLPFYAAAGLSLVNWLYGYFILPESLPVALRTPFSLARANPFGALRGLAGVRGVGGLVLAFALVNLAQFTLHSTWVLYTEMRFGWGPMQNGWSLFAVGLASAVVQGGMMGWLFRHWGETRTALIGLASGALAFGAYGLATSGWVMYAIIAANLLGFASGPALQGIVSRAFGASEQGLTMGALNAINSFMMIVAPLVGTALLAQVAHLPAGDWRVGSTFFLCAGLQGLGLVVAWRHLRRH